MRLLVVLLAVVLVVEVLAMLFFSPSYYVISMSTSALSQELEQKKKLSPVTNEETSIQLARIKKELALLAPSTGKNQILPSELLSRILANKPRGVELNAFAYSRTKESIGLQVSGVSTTREDLLLFKRTLRADPNIADVKDGSGISKQADIDFVITIIMK